MTPAMDPAEVAKPVPNWSTAIKRTFLWLHAYP